MSAANVAGITLAASDFGAAAAVAQVHPCVCVNRQA